MATSKSTVSDVNVSEPTAIYNFEFNGCWAWVRNDIAVRCLTQQEEDAVLDYYGVTPVQSAPPTPSRLKRYMAV